MQTSLSFAPAAEAVFLGEAPFHPAVAAWFQRSFAAPTPAQGQAWAVTARGGHALIAAPTGSGKTLAAFLAAINRLVLDGLAHGLPDAVQVLYVSPLKALSNDIEKNLEAPLAGIRAELAARGFPDVPIRAAVRTGDTSMIERQRMRKAPPHILVTTPESLSILLTSDSGRQMLGNLKTVIVDELHALAGAKRGAHLLLSLERLEALNAQPPARIGLSATVKPLDGMAAYLVGKRQAPCAVIDAGHIRQRDLQLEVPAAPLETVMSNEVWGETYDRLAVLVREHRTTLIFVNQRRVAERVARHLAERLGAEHVAAHHGSLSKEHRLKAEHRLKTGGLKALVATSALELGIDIGDVDLVCQLGSPRSIAALLQRVGRSGHAVGAVPKGRLFPLSLDDLVECAALLDAVRRGELDRILVPDCPLDVLAQHIVAEVACREWALEELHALLCRARPFAGLDLSGFERVVHMLAEGYTTRRGRRGAYLHYDAVNRRLRGRRGARITAVTNAGVIPDQFDCDVVLMPEEQRIGSIGEDFAFESIPGDIFQLGNRSYRILRAETGKVRVEDAHGAPPTIPFWFGEAPARSDELSFAVARLRADADARLAADAETCRRWLQDEIQLHAAAATQLTAYLGAARAALGLLPTQDVIVLERFFDDVGDTHLVIHSSHGARINRAWGLALRKRFCRQFNFELQAAALEDSIVLSLGPTHSFPLDAVRNFLKPATARDVLVQALLDAPMFATRWRWNASAALAVKRVVNGKRLPPQFQRSDAEDLLAVVFPDQLACAENLAGAREIPDHPLVQQTIHDCLHETMDVEGFERLLHRIADGSLRIETRELTSPSPLAQAVISARPYAFLDDGEAEERRTRAISSQRLMDVDTAGRLGRLDAEAIARVRAEVRAEPMNIDELHDALVTQGFLRATEGRPWQPWFEQLQVARRAAVLQPEGGEALWVAAERLAELQMVLPEAATAPAIAALPCRTDGPEAALQEILRSRLEVAGPTTAATLAAPLGLPMSRVEAALLALEAQGSVMRGHFTIDASHGTARIERDAPVDALQRHRDRGDGATSDSDASENHTLCDAAGLEWCERRLLARIHRYTRERQRAEVRPVSPADFMRFLFRWQGLAREDEDARREGEAGLLGVLQQLEGCSIPAAAWEQEILPARVRQYLPDMLDRLCALGRIVWLRPATGDAARRTGPVRTTPVLLGERASIRHWQKAGGDGDAAALSGRARKVFEVLRKQGASFFSDVLADARLMRSDAEQGLAELVSQGLASCDSFAGLRTLILPAHKRERRRSRGLPDIDDAGRWSLPRRTEAPDDADALADPAVEHVARVLLRRYGVVFRKLLEREAGLPPWRELFYVYRRLEARGEIRGGRFVSGFAGEQFALPEAAAGLRKLPAAGEELVSISAADPLNLAGVLTPGDKVPALIGNRLLFRNGVPVAVQIGDEVRHLVPLESRSAWDLRLLLVRRQKPAAYLPSSPLTQ